MEAWLADPQLLEADKGAKYSAEIHINMDDIKVWCVRCRALILVVSVASGLVVRLFSMALVLALSLRNLVNWNHVVTLH
jgi:hypothetical protein